MAETLHLVLMDQMHARGSQQYQSGCVVVEPDLFSCSRFIMVFEKAAEMFLVVPICCQMSRQLFNIDRGTASVVVEGFVVGKVKSLLLKFPLLVPVCFCQE